MVEMSTIIDFGAIVIADIVLSGDNALIIGMAAAGLAPELRKKAIMFGMVVAAVLRVVFAVVATKLLGVPGLLLVGALLLFWVCWPSLGGMGGSTPHWASLGCQRCRSTAPMALFWRMFSSTCRLPRALSCRAGRMFRLSNSGLRRSWGFRGRICFGTSKCRFCARWFRAQRGSFSCSA